MGAICAAVLVGGLGLVMTIAPTPIQQVENVIQSDTTFITNTVIQHDTVVIESAIIGADGVVEVNQHDVTPTNMHFVVCIMPDGVKIVWRNSFIRRDYNEIRSSDSPGPYVDMWIMPMREYYKFATQFASGRRLIEQEYSVAHIVAYNLSCWQQKCISKT